MIRSNTPKEMVCYDAVDTQDICDVETLSAARLRSQATMRTFFLSGFTTPTPQGLADL
jgi:hypothetical protein